MAASFKKNSTGTLETQKLVVFSHKLVWRSRHSASGYATDGGFAFHMKAISEIFGETIVAVPVAEVSATAGEIPIVGNNIKVFPLKTIKNRGLIRKIYYVPWLVSNFFKFYRLISKADVIHVPIPSDIGTLGMMMAYYRKKKLFVRYCGNWAVDNTKAEKLWKRFMVKIAGGNNVMLATGLESVPPSEINPNVKWIFSSSLQKDEINQLKRSVPVFDAENPKLIIVGRLGEAKGHVSVIRAVKILAEDYPGIHLDIVGDGPMMNTFKELIAELNLRDNIILLGKLNHEGVLTALQNAHLFCFPTKSEGFPKAVLEALASGLPVIATPVSAIKELLKDGGGILLENDSPEHLAHQIRTVISDPDLYRQMQAKALLTAAQFTLEDWRDQIKQYLENAWE